MIGWNVIDNILFFPCPFSWTLSTVLKLEVLPTLILNLSKLSPILLLCYSGGQRVRDGD